MDSDFRMPPHFEHNEFREGLMHARFDINERLLTMFHEL